MNARPFRLVGAGNEGPLLRVAASVLLLLLLVVPPNVRAQFSYITNDGTIMITGYTGAEGSMTIPERINGLQVTSITNTAFFGCWLLTKVTVPASVTNIGWFPFGQCSNLAEVSLPDNLITLSTGMFSGCASLTNFTLPRSVTSIAAAAFEYCANLTTVTLPAGVTNIDAWAFQHCCSLTNINIPEGVTSLRNAAFGACTSLPTIVLPTTLTNLADFALADCTNLGRVYFKGNAPGLSASSFGADDGATVYYLPGTTGWDQWVAPPQAVLWNPHVQTTDPSFGVHTNQFGFNVVGTADIPIVVEASTALGSTTWSPLQSCILTNGSIYFVDPQWTNYTARSYRIRSP